MTLDPCSGGQLLSLSAPAGVAQRAVEIIRKERLEEK